MLRRLSIRDIVLIDALDLEFEGGLGALTGETGAGKSILLDSLGLALGARASADLIRAGAEKGSASAVFEPPPEHPAFAWLEEHGFEAEETLILRRVLTGSRARGFINDQPANARAMQALGGLLVEINGQFDDRGLLNPAEHRGLLDRFAGAETPLAATRAAWRTLSKARAAEAEALEAIRTAREDADYIRHSVEEFDRLSPEEGEEERLDADRRRMQRAERLSEEIGKVASLLGASGVEGGMNDALRRLDAAAPTADGRLDAALSALDRAGLELSEAQREVDAALEEMAFDPAELEQTEERLFALRALARKHQISVAELPALAARMAERLAFIENGEARLLDLKAETTAAEAAYAKAAEALSARRVKAGVRLDKMVMAELAPLRMEKARFRTVIDADPAHAGADGIDRVAFEVATNPGAKAGPIDKVASGGELSRFLLAIKVCLADADAGKTLIFDEIDRGVGGATADAIGQRLQRLGGAGQTLVVTHSPQVAARAAAQWRIEKRVAKENGAETTRTQVARITPAGRVEELARMLAGETITDAARAAAEALLADASA